MAISSQKIIPKSFIRLIPAAISMSATFIIVSIIGKNQYGLVSVMLATSSGINSVFFHWARNLIVFENNLKISRDMSNNAWISSLFLVPFPITLLILSGNITLFDSVLILIYLFFQSLFEREVEFLRKNLDLKNYLIISCSRPMLNILAVLIFINLLPTSGVFRGCFLILSISPLISILILKKKLTIPNFRKWNFQSIKIIPSGIMITIPLSYVFLQDAVLKFISLKALPQSSFGEFAVFSDISLSVSWVVISSFCWDFAPLAQSQNQSLKGLFLRKLLILVIAGISITTVIYLTSLKTFLFLIPSTLILTDQYFMIFSNHFIAGVLSSLVFVGFILNGDRKAAFTLSILGLIMLFLNVNYFFKEAILGGLIATNGLIAIIGISLFFFKNSISHSR